MTYQAHTIDYSRLLDILSYCRHTRSTGERMMIDRWIRTVPGIQQDSHGNLYVKIGKSSTMFSCHTDTVHGTQDPVRQELGIFEETNELVVLTEKHVLGADDGAGIEIMLTMIENNVPGLYVFHRDEEVGGKGSLAFANHAGILEGISRCIAFDRKGTDNVITHQFGGRCCSDTFADALIDQFDTLGMRFVKDPTGSFTDSANYTDQISECTNLSVGYYDQHTTKESLDVGFLDDLANACLSIDWESLPAVRDPDAYDYESFGASYGSSWAKSEPRFRTWYDALEFVEQHPEEAADMLFDLYYDDEPAAFQSTRKTRVEYSENGISVEEIEGYTWEDE